jgi:hypothetical protein
MLSSCQQATLLIQNCIIMRGIVSNVQQEFAEWLQSQLDERNWKPADLAAAMGGKSHAGTVSRILNEGRAGGGVGKQTAIRIATALKLPAELVLQKAGYPVGKSGFTEEGLDPISLDILEMVGPRSETERLAARAAIKALFESLDRGKNGSFDTSRDSKPSKGT